MFSPNLPPRSGECWFWNETFCLPDFGPDVTCNVTHWRSLPEGPAILSAVKARDAAIRDAVLEEVCAICRVCDGDETEECLICIDIRALKKPVAGQGCR